MTTTPLYISLKDLRAEMRVTQTEFATAMGMPLRSYQDIESGKNPVRPVHVAAAKWAAIELADKAGKGCDFLPVTIGDTIKRVAART